MPIYTYVNKENKDDVIEKEMSIKDFKREIEENGKIYVKTLDVPSLIMFKGNSWTVKNQLVKERI